RTALFLHGIHRISPSQFPVIRRKPRAYERGRAVNDPMSNRHANLEKGQRSTSSPPGLFDLQFLAGLCKNLQTTNEELLETVSVHLVMQSADTDAQAGSGSLPVLVARLQGRLDRRSLDLLHRLLQSDHVLPRCCGEFRRQILRVNRWALHGHDETLHAVPQL